MNLRVLLPQRLDCVAALVPGILTYETQAPLDAQERDMRAAMAKLEAGFMRRMGSLRHG